MKAKTLTPEALTEIKPLEAEKFVLDREKHIVISGKVYNRSDIPDEATRIIATVNFADQEIATAEQNLQLYKYGRDRMVSDLIELIESSDLQAVAEKAPEPTE